MKKRYLVSIITISLISLTGCSRVNSYLEEKIFEKSGILQDEIYIEYQSQMGAGNVDEEGYYVDGMQQTQNGSIHVTFYDKRFCKCISASYNAGCFCKDYNRRLEKVNHREHIQRVCQSKGSERKKLS